LVLNNKNVYVYWYNDTPKRTVKAKRITATKRARYIFNSVIINEFIFIIF